MSSKEFTAIVRAAFRESQKSRLRAGIRLNRNPPRRYRITVWLRPEQYLDIVQTAARTGFSVSRVLSNSVYAVPIGRRRQKSA